MSIRNVSLDLIHNLDRIGIFSEYKLISNYVFTGLSPSTASLSSNDSQYCLVPGTSNSSSTYTTYQWIPDPAISTGISILIIVITLLPAICSLCYHFTVRRSQDAEVSHTQLVSPGKPTAETR